MHHKFHKSECVIKNKRLASDYTMEINNYEIELKEVSQKLTEYPKHVAQMSTLAMRKALEVNYDPANSAIFIDRLELLARQESILETIKILRRYKDRDSIIELESGVDLGETHDGEIKTEVVNENFTDVTGEVVDHTHVGKSTTLANSGKNLLSLDDFFSRPLVISTFTAPMNSDISTTLKVWDLYSLSSTFRAKMKNYAYFRGNLHVRISATGTPFNFGRALVSYQPFPSANDALTNLLAAVASNSLYRPALLSYLSQAPGSAIINLNENTPVEIEIPFISPQPLFRLFNYQTTVISGATSFTDFANAGSIYIYSINTPKSVSTSPSAISFQVYCWASEVELGTATGTQLSINTESGKDERIVGPVERLASRFVGLTRQLSSFAVLRPYAVASNLVGQGVEQLSAVLGWSRPSLIVDPVYMKNQPLSNTASTVGGETNLRLTLDPKQELSVDPRVGGVDRDELLIDHIARVSSFIGTFTWASSDTPLTGALATIGVTPNVGITTSVTTKTLYQPSSMAFAAQPFSYWHGSIVYRFEIVASKIHRGKIAVYYEPNVEQYTLIKAGMSTTRNYMCVIDIQETQVFEVCVNWGSNRAWLYVGDTMYNINTSVVGGYGDLNGFIVVTPFTKLVSPDGSSISINTYVKAKDIAFNVLSDEHVPIARIPVQSGRDVEEAPSVSCIELNPASQDGKGLCELTFGERPISFRALLRRYTHEISSVFEPSALYGNSQFVGTIIPKDNMSYQGTQFQSVDLFNYLRYAFVGARGGIKRKIQAGPGSAGALAYPMVHAGVSLANPDSGSITAAAGSRLPWSRMAGTVKTVPATQGGLEVEFPCYMPNLMWCSFSSTNEFTNSMTTYTRDYIIDLGPIQSISDLSIKLQTDFAVADDFIFIRYQGAPFYTNVF